MNKYMRILDYYNSNPLDSTYSRIIRFVLLNRNKLSEMTIKDVADTCFVSNATISRFSQYFGFEDFSNMKEHLSLNFSSANQQFRLSKGKIDLLEECPLNFFEVYINQIIKALIDLNDNFDIEINDQLLEIINQKDKVFVFGALDQYFIFRDIQNSFMRSNKLINIAYNYNDYGHLLDDVDEDSLIIVVSSFGGFFAENDDFMRKIFKKGCCTYLITQNTETIVQQAFTKVIKLTSKNHIEIGSYPIIAWSEYITRRYYTLYGKLN